MDFIDRYDPAQIGELLVETAVEGEDFVLVFRCPATHHEVTLSWRPVPETEAQLEKCIVEGFRSLEGDFHWDGSRWIWWDANDRVSEFERVFYSQEFDSFDRKMLLARTLHAVLRADGVLHPEEQALFEKLCPGFEGLEEPPPFEELAQLPKRVREQVFGLSCAMAWCDFQADPAENELLETLADHLALTRLRAWGIQEAARHFLVDRRLDKQEPEEVAMLAGGLDMTSDVVQQLAERHRLRRSHEVEPPEGGETTDLLNEWILRA